MNSIILKYYDTGTSTWIPFTYYYTSFVDYPEIEKLSGKAKCGTKYQITIDKRYSYKIDLLLSPVSPYTTTLTEQKEFLYNFLTHDQMRFNNGSDVDVVCTNDGLIQLDMIENSSYIRSISLDFSDVDATSGDF